MTKVEERYSTLYNTECPICLTDVREIDELVKASCGHVFRSSCIEGWRKLHDSCPFDRQPLGECHAIYLFDDLHDSQEGVEPALFPPYDDIDESAFQQILSSCKNPKKALPRIQALSASFFTVRHLEVLANKRWMIAVKYLVDLGIEPHEELRLAALHDKSLAKALSLPIPVKKEKTAFRQPIQDDPFLACKKEKRAFAYLSKNQITFGTEHLAHSVELGWKAMTEFLLAQGVRPTREILLCAKSRCPKTVDLIEDHLGQDYEVKRSRQKYSIDW